MTDSIPLVVLAVVLSLLLGYIWGWYSAQPPTRHDATVPNFVTTHREPQILDWLTGNKRELVLLKLLASKTFTLDKYVTSRLLTDGEWRQARRELVECGVIAPGANRVAFLTPTGKDWCNTQIYGRGTNSQTYPNPETGEGGPDNGFTRIKRGTK
jgi:hypothetical protein